MIMVKTMIGTATTPFSTALQNSALIGSIVEYHAEASRERDRAVEGLRRLRLARETTGPLQCLGQGISRGPGQHRHREQAGADDAKRKEDKGKGPGDRA